MWFLKEEHSGFSKNHNAQGSVTRTKCRMNTGRLLEVSTHVDSGRVGGMGEDPGISQGPGWKRRATPQSLAK